MRVGLTCRLGQTCHSPHAIWPCIDRLTVTRLQRVSMWWSARSWADYTMTTDWKSGPRKQGVEFRPSDMKKESFNE
jgi:hypothetical protein